MKGASVKAGIDLGQAETVALKALGWIAADQDRLDRFVALTGLAPGEIAVRASEPEMLGAVLDCLLGDERWVHAFCEDAGIAPEDPGRARTALPGADAPFWT